jgi:hypothetical protein
MKTLIKLFRIHLGWFFINGNKREAWERYLRKTYGND